ncbi:hypothetical protein FNV43_RR11846 [Rhamnella rubrinervis]|uniref:EF-hand domain-containing protein n=1 Tax=Rhamnella rubrinervis TaxID=2594499 RepID=A0A8K0H6J9_9ROSA|nr:hypothetical protein FNV43_RR11846 [Rhamnella rubrinervis]
MNWGIETTRCDVSVTYTEAQLKEMFRRYDRDGDGSLNWQDLKMAFSSLGSAAPSCRVFRALRHADGNKEGYINLDFELDNLVKYVSNMVIPLDSS